MKLEREKLHLYAITDRGFLNGRNMAEAVEEAILGGAGIIQLREKGLSTEEFIREAKEVKAVTEKYGVPLIINDRVKVCIKSGADGVHLGQSDMEVMGARKLLGKGKIIGASVKTPLQAVLAEKMGADYLGVGAAFSTSTKGDASKIDHRTYREIKNAVSIPVFAIGGINEENICELEGCGADGVAVVSAVFGKENIRDAAEKMKALSEKYLGES